LVAQLFVLTLQELNLLLLVPDLLLEGLVRLQVKGHLLLSGSTLASRAFQWQINHDLCWLLRCIFELVKLLLKLLILLVGEFLRFGELLNCLFMLPSDGFDLSLEQIELLVELLAMLLSRLLGVSGGRVLLNNHVMKRFEIMALPVEAALEGVLLLLKGDSCLLQRVLVP
jgi:hypothetical protein